ncbi:MAG: SDR family NAD(P)-dependent oxidoreductase [Bacteroidota bacterium]|nr:SDR family NAD(P)-dependent oxidoreductase [Bacteroidota bacterium]
MNYYFITGTSRGLGKSIAQQLLLDPKNHVFGFSRTNTISHERFSFQQMDFSDTAAVGKWDFPLLADAEKICLVNNAGAIGAVKHVGQLHSAEITSAINVNLVAPALLANSFLRAYSSLPAKQVIINVSSGAGKNPSDGWSAYCATKAGLDMFTRTVAEELKIDGKTHIFTFSVAPGLVDSAMQDHIRTITAVDFSRIQAFIDYKNNGQLAHPDLVAEKYLAILELPEKFKDVLFSVKDI